jgi:hypothetical protein
MSKFLKNKAENKVVKGLHQDLMSKLNRVQETKQIEKIETEEMEVDFPFEANKMKSLLSKAKKLVLWSI